MRAIRAIMIKELLQLSREKLTFGMIIGMPLVMMLLFGYVINNDPRNLPTGVVNPNPSDFTRSFIASLENSGYFAVEDGNMTEEDARKSLQTGKLQFVVNIPHDFTVRLLRRETPEILIEADGTDPTATASALSALAGILESAVAKHPELSDKTGENFHLPASVIVHNRYNPEKITRNNVVPGLIGVVLTMTLVLMTALSVTRELERGTLENLLVMPVKPYEVILGKLIPYIFIGILQALLILLIAVFHFKIPMLGNPAHCAIAVLLFESAVLMVGITISSVAKSQLQAMQMTLFFFLPSIFLSGYIFPFRGMPVWGQFIGNLLPLTYFNRLIRGIMLKGADVPLLLPHIYPLLIFITVMFFVAVKAYRRTLD